MKYESAMQPLQLCRAWIVREFVGRRNGSDINDKGCGIENGPIHMLAGEIPRVPIVYGEATRPEFENDPSLNLCAAERSVPKPIIHVIPA